MRIELPPQICGCRALALLYLYVITQVTGHTWFCVGGFCVYPSQLFTKLPALTQVEVTCGLLRAFCVSPSVSLKALAQVEVTCGLLGLCLLLSSVRALTLSKASAIRGWKYPAASY